MAISTDKKAGFILAGIAVTEGAWVLFNLQVSPVRFFRYAGFLSLKDVGPGGWILAILFSIAFLAFSVRLPSVRANLFRPSGLKLLGLVVAVVAGFCEELVFRKLLMDSLQHSGYGIAVQLSASALTFGVVHAVWGLIRGSFGAAFRITAVTGMLGLALAIVYLVSHRNVAPCVVAHFLINAFAEPGLVLAAVKGEMPRANV